MFKIFNKNKVQKTDTCSKFGIQTNRGKYIINTTEKHTLHKHLTTLKLYDRFLPVLASITKTGVIDIGANIGDTAVLIKSLSEIPIVCVEPDAEFITLIHKNIADNNLSDVIVYPFPVSYEQKNVTIEKNSINSSGNITDHDLKGNLSFTRTKTIRELIDSLKLKISDYGILKIDTDGFDWDCLKSLVELYNTSDVEKFKYVFYEHQNYLNNLGPNDASRCWREDEYIKALRQLQEHGFDTFFIFDNYGSFILETKDIETLKDINSYIIRSQCINLQSTIYFVDVLICSALNTDDVRIAINEYTKDNISVL